MDVLLTAVFGIASSAILSLFKKTTGALDTQVGKVVKPVQPLFVAILTAVLPLVSNLFHLTAVPDATAIANAPLGALIGIIAREIALRLTPKAPVGDKSLPQ